MRPGRVHLMIKTGSLVQFRSKPGVPLKRVGLVLEQEYVDNIDDFYRVRWTETYDQDREWFRAVELRVIGEK